MPATLRDQPARSFRTMMIRCCAALAVVLGCWLTSPVQAQAQDNAQDAAHDVVATDPPAGQQSDWLFTVGIYGWLTSVHGELTSPNYELDYSIPFSDIFEHIDAVLEAVGEVRWRRWLLSFDGTWLSLEGEHEDLLFDLNLKVKQQIYDLHAGYGIYQRTRWDGAGRGKQPWRLVTAVDVILGARNFATQTTISTFIHLTQQSSESTYKNSRWDPIIGARGTHSFSRRWGVDLIADIGGFGIGNSAEFTYRVDFNVGFRLWQPLTLFVGYRVIGYELTSDAPIASGMIINGPKIGAKMDF